MSRCPLVPMSQCPHHTYPLSLIHALEGVLWQRVIAVAQPGHHGAEELRGKPWGGDRASWGGSGSPHNHPHPLLTSSFFCSSVFSPRYTAAGTNLRAGCSLGAWLTVRTARCGAAPGGAAPHVVPTSPLCTYLASCRGDGGRRGAAARPPPPARRGHRGPAPTIRGWEGRCRPGNTPSAGRGVVRDRGASTRPPHAASPHGYLDTRHAESHRLEGALAQPQRSGELHLAHVARRLAQENEALGGAGR